MNNQTNMAFISVSKDGWTDGIQLSICDENGGGFRIHGPKFNGSGKILVNHKLTQWDADEIRHYLDRAFPSALKIVEKKR